jgi:hypothetical protein
VRIQSPHCTVSPGSLSSHSQRWLPPVLAELARLGDCRGGGTPRRFAELLGERGIGGSVEAGEVDGFVLERVANAGAGLKPALTAGGKSGDGLVFFGKLRLFVDICGFV